MDEMLMATARMEHRRLAADAALAAAARDARAGRPLDRRTRRRLRAAGLRIPRPLFPTPLTEAPPVGA